MVAGLQFVERGAASVDLDSAVGLNYAGRPNHRPSTGMAEFQRGLPRCDAEPLDAPFQFADARLAQSQSVGEETEHHHGGRGHDRGRTTRAGTWQAATS
jgi:hypothetical protein